jgi:hypothetical protein
VTINRAGFRGARVNDTDRAEARADARVARPAAKLTQLAAAQARAQPAQSAGHSEFESRPPAASAPATPAPPEAVAARSTEVTALTGTTGPQRSADVVRPETQVATITQAAKPEERDAVQAHFGQARADDRTQAFDAVLTASTTQGTRPVALGPFTGSVTVDAKGDVNGKPLPSDAEVEAASQLANLSNDDRKAQLKQVGVSDQWLAAASEQQVRSAFNQVEMQRRFGAPGAASVQLPELRQQLGRVRSSIPGGAVTFTVTGDRQLTNAAGATAPASSQGALARIAEAEAKEWPAGAPEARLKTRIEDTQLKVSVADKLNTITSALSEADAARVSTLINTPPGVSSGSIDAAYQSVLDARKTPGSKSVDLALSPLREDRTTGESESVSIVEQPPVSFRAAMEVSADGKVNGKALGVDELAKLSSQIATVPTEAKDAALKEAGLSDQWVSQASMAQKDYALAKLRQAAMSPGMKSLDVSFDVTGWEGGESGSETTTRVDGTIQVSVGADGKIGGKTPQIEVALATTLTMERMPMVEKRQMLGQLGMPADVLRAATPQEASDLLTRVALRTRTPGEQQFEAVLGGKDYIVGLKVGAKGDIEAAGAQLKPPQPKQNKLKQLIGPILTVASFVFPVAAPALQAINAAIAIKNGARGLSLVASVAGAVAGVGGMVANLAGAGSSIASAASTVANVAGRVASISGAANGVHQGAKTGDFLGAFSSVVSLAGQVGSLTNTTLGSNFDLLQRAGTAAGYASRALNGDIAGLGAEVLGTGLRALVDNAAQGATAPQAAVRQVDDDVDDATTQAPSTTDFSLGAGARLGQSGESTVKLGTGDDGASLGPSTGAPQADVQRVEPQVDGTAVTTPRITVRRGDNLSRIARSQLGDPSRTPELYAWNAARIGNDPNALRAGVELELPPSDFRLSQAERDAFFRSTHVAPPPSGSGFSDNLDARDLRSRSGGPTTTATPPAPSTRASSGAPDLGANTQSAEWGGFDAPVEGTGKGPAFLAAAKLKFELTAGTFKAEVGLSAESGLAGKISNGNVWEYNKFELKTGPLKFAAEPSISVDANGNFKLEGKVQGAAGPVSVSLKGSIDQDGNYKVDGPVVGADPRWLSVGFKVLGVGVKLEGPKIETGPLLGRLAGTLDAKIGVPPPELDHLNGHHSP